MTTTPSDPRHKLFLESNFEAIPSRRMIPLKVISLERSHERRAFMQRQLDDLGLPFRFFNAIDGSKMTATKFGEAVGVKLTPGEIGCGLSHLAGIREIAEGEHEYAAILEDDVFVLPETSSSMNNICARYRRSTFSNLMATI